MIAANRNNAILQRPPVEINSGWNAEEWQSFFFGPALDSGERLSILVDLAEAGRLEGNALRVCLPDVWTSSDKPAFQVNKKRLIAVYRRVGFVSDVENVSMPADGLKIFRGCTPHEKYGLSWTTDPEKAAFFCKYSVNHRARALSSRGPKIRRNIGSASETPIIYEAYAPPSAILALLYGRDEDEVVVDPYKLRDIREARWWPRDAGNMKRLASTGRLTSPEATPDGTDSQWNETRQFRMTKQVTEHVPAADLPLLDMSVSIRAHIAFELSENDSRAVTVVV